MGWSAGAGRCALGSSSGTTRLRLPKQLLFRLPVTIVRYRNNIVFARMLKPLHTHLSFFQHTMDTTTHAAMPGGKPGDKPGGKPGGRPGGRPGGKPGGKPGGRPGGRPGGKPGGRPGGKPGGKHENMQAWSPEEDTIILDMHIELGPSWSNIVQRLPGRTVSSVRNRWQRIECGRKQREAGVPSKNRCHACGLPKRGHVCQAKLGGGPNVVMGPPTVTITNRLGGNMPVRSTPLSRSRLVETADTRWCTLIPVPKSVRLNALDQRFKRMQSEENGEHACQLCGAAGLHSHAECIQKRRGFILPDRRQQLRALFTEQVAMLEWTKFEDEAKARFMPIIDEACNGGGDSRRRLEDHLKMMLEDARQVFDDSGHIPLHDIRDHEVHVHFAMCEGWL